jgi:predicted dinucleotide-binding enzyme
VTKRIGILGSGTVGKTLAKGLSGSDSEVAIGSRAGGTIDGWEGNVGTFVEVAEKADILILSVKGEAAEALVATIKTQLANKTIIDTTNPIASTPPVDGVLNFFTSLDESLMERLQQAAPDAHFVKAFNSVGSGNMVNPHYAGGKPSMFICGNDKDAKLEVTKILTQLGWETEDMGSARAARAIEPLCMLWCIPGMLHNQWTHAFKLLK